MRTFFFTCPVCNHESGRVYTTSGGNIPLQDDQDKSFYISCLNCFSIIMIEIKITKTVMMTSNIKKESINEMA